MPHDAEYVATLVDDVGGPLRAYAATWSRTPDDLVQEAFCRLVAQRDRPERPRAWLFTVVRNLAREASRHGARRTRREVKAATSESVDGGLERVEGRDVATLVDDLPAELREVVVARLWGDLTFSEIAELVGASTASVHRRYRSALEILRQRVEPCPNQPTTTSTST